MTHLRQWSTEIPIRSRIDLTYFRGSGRFRNADPTVASHPPTTRELAGKILARVISARPQPRPSQLRHRPMKRDRSRADPTPRCRNGASACADGCPSQSTPASASLFRFPVSSSLLGGYDEPETLRYKINSDVPGGPDGGHYGCAHVSSM